MLKLKAAEVHGMFMDIVNNHPFALYIIAKQMKICPQTLKGFMTKEKYVGLKTLVKIEQWCIKKKYDLAEMAEYGKVKDLMDRYAPVLEKLAKE